MVNGDQISQIPKVDSGTLQDHVFAELFSDMIKEYLLRTA